MKKVYSSLFALLFAFAANATTHTIQVWDGYFQFTPNQISVQLGDTIQWLPLDDPMMVHTITASTIPEGAADFDYIWQSPTNLFFQYVPQVVGVYNYYCVPHLDEYNMVGSFTVEGPLNTTELSTEDAAIAVYPNPASNQITIEGIKDLSEFEIYDLAGNRMMSGVTNFDLNISSLSAGLYFLRLNGDRSKTIKIIKE